MPCFVYMYRVRVTWNLFSVVRRVLPSFSSWAPPFNEPNYPNIPGIREHTNRPSLQDLPPVGHRLPLSAIWRKNPCDGEARVENSQNNTRH